MASAFPLRQWLGVLWQIKKWYSYWDFGFVGSKNGFTIGKLLKVKVIFRTYKTNEKTTDVYAKLLKTVTEKVHRIRDNRIISYWMANVVEDSGEGRCFL